MLRRDFPVVSSELVLTLVAGRMMRRMRGHKSSVDRRRGIRIDGDEDLGRQWEEGTRRTSVVRV